MASENVIELGSSDDEALPPPDRNVATTVIKAKPTPKLNAMVNIPDKIKLQNVTIKPTGLVKKSTKQRGLAGQSSPINILTKCNLNNQTTITPLQSNKHSVLGSKVLPSQKSYSGTKIGNRNNTAMPMKILNNKKACINPLNLMKNLDKSQIVINKVSGPSKSNVAVVKTPTKLVNPVGKLIGMPHPVLRLPHPVARLPPSVTVTQSKRGTKHPIISNVTSLRKKQKVVVSPKFMNVTPKPNLQILSNKLAASASAADDPLRDTGEVFTVELDDEAVEASSSKPQWYMRPEDQPTEESKELEKQNNKEPETPKYIEICIEDSPVSKPKNRRTFEIDNAILIEDSPVRHGTPKKPAADSDSENDDQKHKTPKKKRRKLDYSVEVPILERSIEIEIEPMEIDGKDNGNKDEENNEVETSRHQKTTEADKDEVNELNNEAVIEICESPAKTNKGPPRVESNKHSPKQTFDVKSADVELVAEDGEFHPVYQQFIDLCFKLDNSNDMKTIVEKKIKGYYKQVPKEYTESEEFIDMVSSKIVSMKAGKEKMYLYIKDVVDELNLQRKMAKNELVKKQAEKKESGKLTFTDDSEFDSKRQRQIRKLEKTVRKLHRAIEKLEEQEVDFDDEEDSVYLLAERYKERMVRVHAKLCQLTNTKLPSEPRVHIESRPGQPTGPAKRLEQWINKKVPIGKPLPFPDFHDVLRIVREANSEDKLGWNEADIMEEARDLFTRCGKKLQRRRQEIEWRIAASRLTTDVDPAEDNDDLKTKLERNRLLASKKEIDVFDKYAERQSEMKLEGEEIGDKEMEESPLESEDDEVTEEASGLSDKEKRKERLKRLIQERSHKKSLEKKDDLHIIEPDHITPDSPEVSADTNMEADKDPLEVTENAEPEIEDVEPKTTEYHPKVTKNKTDKTEPENDREPETAEIQPVVTNDSKEDDSKETEINDKEPDKAKIQSEKTDNEKENNATKKDIKSKYVDEIEINSDSNVSEADELHLLEKLYSESENNSTGDSSDSDSPIDISDTENSDNAKDNVISIENSTESDTRDSDPKGPKDYKNENKPLEMIEEIENSNDDLIESQVYDEIIEKGDCEHNPLETDTNKMNGDCMITPDPISNDETVSKDKKTPDPISNDETVSKDKQTPDLVSHDEKVSKDKKVSVKSTEPNINDEIEESLECVINSIDSIIKPTLDTNVEVNTAITSQLTEKHTSTLAKKQEFFLASETELENSKDETISKGETIIQRTVLEENDIVKDSKTNTANCESITENDDLITQKGKSTTISISTHNLATTDSVEQLRIMHT